MFGHQSDDHQHDNQEPQHDGVLDHQHDEGQHTDDPMNPALPSNVDDFGAPVSDAPVSEAPAHNGGDDSFASADSEDSDTSTTVEPSHHDSAVNPTNDLLDIKTQALQQLTPLVGHLEQTPEEKFRTTMMMIQASDDQSLVKVAYEAARQITDEKAKAQALLDIVNEINYFTHQGNDSEA